MAPNTRARLYRPSTLDLHKRDFPFYWIARVNNLYAMEMERALKSVDCDIPTWRVLAILTEQGSQGISDIAVDAVIKLSTITKIVHRMKAEGLVKTAPSTQDARVTQVTLTEAGTQAFQRARDATNGLLDRSFSGLTPLRIERLNESLQQIFVNMSGRL